MARKHVNTTKYEIIQQATTLFLEKGYSATPPKLICDALDISTGNLTYYFPTKEHLLAVLVDMLCRFQGKLMETMVQEEGTSSLLALCLELITMAAMSEENPIAKDLFLSSYSSPMSLEIIRKNDCQRAKRIFCQFCPDWSDLQYVEAEALTSGIEYATFMTTNDSAPLEVRVSAALNNILMLYNVPEETRKENIRKALSLDYLSLSRQILDQFKHFVHQTNDQTFEALLCSTGK